MKNLLIIAGPSGVGKTYLAHSLLQQSPELFTQGQLYTTRRLRPGEHSPDRIFVSDEEFAAKQQAGDFFIAERFHGHWYGYPQELLQSEGEGYIVVNAWPALIPQFQSLQNILMVGLTVDVDRNLDLLEQRMSDRGYTAKQMKERLLLIRRDIADLAAQTERINGNGRVFLVKDNSTIPDEIIPWVLASD